MHAEDRHLLRRTAARLSAVLAIVATAATLVTVLVSGASGAGFSIRYRGGPANFAPSPWTAAAAWCGTNAETATNRPDTSLSSPNLVHVTYAVPSDGADRFASFANGIKTDVDAIGVWWAGQDATRGGFRFDRAAFPGCADLDLSVVRLPQPGSFYSDPSTRPPRLAADLATLAPTMVKSLVYYDGPVAAAVQYVCGTTIARAPGVGGGLGFSFVWLQSSCPIDVGQGRLDALVAAHELTHGMGAVPPGAPHACPGDTAHVCDSTVDLMYPTLGPGSALGGAILDVGRDDYYGFIAAGHSGGVFDVQSSPWLVRLPQFPLAVAVTGGGKVRVTGPAGAAECATACATQLETSVQVTLTAEPDSGNRLVSWQGSCTGRSLDCNLTADGSKNATALFGPASYTVVVSVKGKGKVTSSPAGISCPRRCTATFTAPATATLRARPKRGWAFAGWRGGCRGKAACKLSAAGHAAVRALFRRR
jgi:Divergent InlB B-repeat domain